MLAYPPKGVHEVFNRFKGLKSTCEKEDGKVNIYSRSQEDSTSKCANIVKGIANTKSEVHVKSCVLYCEAVSWDKKTKPILPIYEIKVQVCVFMFDLLY